MAVFSRVKTWVTEVLTASDLNTEFDNIINNMKPDGIEDASVDTAAMQALVNPGGVGTESLATDLLGELKRIRYALKRIVGGAQWYVAPVIDLGSTIDTADITALAVTPAKIANLSYITAISQVVTITNASPAVFTTPDVHSLTVGQRIALKTSGALPTGLTEYTFYYVTATPSTTTYRVSASAGGADINTSSAGSGVHVSIPVVEIGQMLGSTPITGLTWSSTTAATSAGLCAAIVTNGRPVRYATTLSGTSGGSWTSTSISSVNNFTFGGVITVFRNGTQIGQVSIGSYKDTTAGALQNQVKHGVNVLTFEDPVAAGSYVYSFDVGTLSANTSSFTADNPKITIREM